MKSIGIVAAICVENLKLMKLKNLYTNLKKWGNEFN